MADLAVTPVQNNGGITSNDVGLTVGAAAVGALGGGSMYFKTPSEDAFFKSGKKVINNELAKEAETLTAAVKEAKSLEAGKSLANETVEAVKKLGVTEPTVDNLKTKLGETINKISDQKVFDKAKAAANEALGEANKFADDALKMADDAAAKTGLFARLGLTGENATPAKAVEKFKELSKKAADTADDASKKILEIGGNAKKAAGLRWGAIAAAALAVLTAGYLYFTKGNSEVAEQPAQTEKA